MGYNTKQVTTKKFVGIRNRYCCVCELANNKNIKVPIHKCFLNWNKASTAMEADGIMEGFLNSMSMHGLKYNKLIGKLYISRNNIFHFLYYINYIFQETVTVASPNE